MSTWGVFLWEDRDGRASNQMVLLGRWKRRIEAPDLAKVVETYAHGSKVAATRTDNEGKKLEEKEIVKLCLGPDAAQEHIEGHHPDAVYIENKASGIQLVKELRRRRNPATPVQPWTPPRGLRVTGLQSSTTGREPGKFARAQLGSIVLESGAVWYMDVPWAEEVIDGCAKCRFDGSDESDDLEDTVVMAFLIVRQRYMVETESDIDEEEEAEDDWRMREQRNVRFYGRPA